MRHATRVPVATPVAHLPLNGKASDRKCHSQQPESSYVALRVLRLKLVLRCDVRNVARDCRPLRLSDSVVCKEGRSVPYLREAVNALCKGRVRLVRMWTFGWSVKKLLANDKRQEVILEAMMRTNDLSLRLLQVVLGEDSQP